MNKKQRRELEKKNALAATPTTEVETPTTEAEPLTEEQAQDFFQPQEPVAPTVVKPTTPTASKYRALGLVPGMPSRVMAYQDATLAHNNDWRLTDAQLASLWNQEFPGAIVFKPGLVAVVRREYNDGKHGGQSSKPEVGSVAYGPTGEVAPVSKRTKRDDVANAAVKKAS